LAFLQRAAALTNKSQLASTRLKVEKDFAPCAEAGGDELYPNGIFLFNITKMIEWIQDNRDRGARGLRWLLEREAEGPRRIRAGHRLIVAGSMYGVLPGLRA
jgi:hypothetical protein